MEIINYLIEKPLFIQDFMYVTFFSLVFHRLKPFLIFSIPVSDIAPKANVSLLYSNTGNFLNGRKIMTYRYLKYFLASTNYRIYAENYF